MIYLAFRNRFNHFGVFSTSDIKKWLPRFDSRRLVEWQEKGYIKKVINRWYIFSNTRLEDHFLFLIANKIYQPSYISFESALAYYNLIPEGVYTITSATSVKTKSFDTIVGKFSYRHIKPGLMFGYQLIDWNGIKVKMAELEKLLLDYLYLNHHIKRIEDLESLRLNTDFLNRELKKDRFNEYLSLFKKQALEKRAATFLKYLSVA